MKRFCGFIEEHGVRKYPLEMELPDGATVTDAAKAYQRLRGILASVHPIKAVLLSEARSAESQEPDGLAPSPKPPAPRLPPPRKTRPALKAPPSQ